MPSIQRHEDPVMQGHGARSTDVAVGQLSRSSPGLPVPVHRADTSRSLHVRSQDRPKRVMILLEQNRQVFRCLSWLGLA